MYECITECFERANMLLWSCKSHLDAVWSRPCALGETLVRLPSPLLFSSPVNISACLALDFSHTLLTLGKSCHITPLELSMHFVILEGSVQSLGDPLREGGLSAGVGSWAPSHPMFPSHRNSPLHPL